MSFHERVLCESYNATPVAKLQSTECDSDLFGPALPPHLSAVDSSRSMENEVIYGSALPDFFKEKEKGKSNGVPFPISEEKNISLIGPIIPEHLKSKFIPLETGEKVSTIAHGEDDNFGPSTALMAKGEDTGYYKFIIAENLRKKNECIDKSSIKREPWMLELPEKKKSNFGLLSRHFKSRIQTDKESDDSVWTDTPVEREMKKNSYRKKDYKEIVRIKRLKERDREMEKLAKKATKKLRKKESLLDMHLKSMRKKKKKDESKTERKLKPERRPFDRNLDLQIRKIDETQKRIILSKSQFLNDRFASGQSKFL